MLVATVVGMSPSATSAGSAAAAAAASGDGAWIAVGSAGTPVKPGTMGLNDVLGPIQAMRYDNDVLCQATRSLRVGILRYPGGTVANYWNVTSGQYVPGFSAKCSCYSRAPVVDAQPEGTFSARSFASGVGRCTASRSGVWLINLLTMNTSQTLGQLEELVSSGVPLDNLELGNEFYLDQYAWRFDSPASYAAAAKPVIARARQIARGTTIAAIAKCSSIVFDKGTWNQQVAANLGDLVDAVTLHDYSLNANMVSHLGATQQLSFVAAYSDAVVRKVAQAIPKLFSSSTRVLMTEFNMSPKNPPMPAYINGAPHGFFWASRFIAAANRPELFDVLQYHVLASVEGEAWDSKTGVWYTDGNKPSSLGATQINGVGQIFAHVSAVVQAHGTIFPSDIGSTGTLGVRPLGFQLPCLQALAVGHAQAGGPGFRTLQSQRPDLMGASGRGFVVINRCDRPVTTTLQLGGETSSSCAATTYAGDDMGGLANLPPAGAAFPWSGPLKPTTSTHKAAGSTVSLQFEQVSLTVLTC